MRRSERAEALQGGERPFAPRALGEIAIRCRDFPAMIDFYGDVLGLSRLLPGERGGYRDGIAFFRLGESHAGHVAVLALFADGVSGEPAEGGDLSAGHRSSLHHLALSLSWSEQEGAVDWLRARGLEVTVRPFEWTGWRGVFVRDPDGNLIELVAADPDWHIG